MNATIHTIEFEHSRNLSCERLLLNWNNLNQFDCATVVVVVVEMHHTYPTHHHSNVTRVQKGVLNLIYVFRFALLFYASTAPDRIPPCWWRCCPNPCWAVDLCSSRACEGDSWVSSPDLPPPSTWKRQHKISKRLLSPSSMYVLLWNRAMEQSAIAGDLW